VLDRRESAVMLPQDLPDLVKLADAYGIPGFRAETIEDLSTVLEKAAQVTDQPVIVDIRVDPDEMVFPMIPAGASNDAIIESHDEWLARAAAGGNSGVAPS